MNLVGVTIFMVLNLGLTLADLTSEEKLMLRSRRPPRWRPPHHSYQNSHYGEKKQYTFNPSFNLDFSSNSGYGMPMERRSAQGSLRQNGRSTAQYLRQCYFSRDTANTELLGLLGLRSADQNVPYSAQFLDKYSSYLKRSNSFGKNQSNFQRNINEESNCVIVQNQRSNSIPLRKCFSTRDATNSELISVMGLRNPTQDRRYDNQYLGSTGHGELRSTNTQVNCIFVENPNSGRANTEYLRKCFSYRSAADTELIGLLGLQNAGQENRYGRSYSDDNYSTHLNRDFTTGNYQDAISQSRDNSNNQLNCVFAFNRKRDSTKDDDLQRWYG